MAKVALTNEARARHYAKAANYWKLADATQNTPSDSEVKPTASSAAAYGKCGRHLD